MVVTHDRRSYATRMFRALAVKNAVAGADGAAVPTPAIRLALLLAVWTGAVLRVLEFAVLRPVSVDEAALARTILGHGWATLFGPLDYGQVAPAGFLAAQKLALHVSQHEAALRFVPMLAALATLPLSLAVARRLVSGAAGLCFVLCMAVASPIVAYAATGKPYALDVAASLVVWLIALDADAARSRRDVVRLAALAVPTALVSFTAVFTLAAAAVVALLRAVQRPGTRAIHGGCALAWGATSALGYGLAQVGLSTTDADYMQWFWMSGFPPAGASAVVTLHWLWAQSASLFGQTLRYRGSSVCVVLAIVGAVSLARRRGPDALLVTGPVLLVLGAAVMHRYPFTAGRVQLFLVPHALLLVAEGAHWCAQALRQRVSLVYAVPLLFVATTSLYGAVRSDRPPEIDRPPIRLFLREVARAWQPGDRLFVHYTEAQQYLYYASRIGLPSDAVVVGACSRGVGRPYLRDAATLLGHRRVWVALTHRSDLETDLLRAFLDTSGRREWTGLSADDGGYGYRYDLAEFRQLPADAEHLPLPAPLDNAEPFRWSCYGVFEPFAKAR